MIPERQKVCEGCDYLNRVAEHGCYCKQKCYPIAEEEYRMMGVTKKDKITPEGIEKLMDISMKPECKERMLRAHPIEWWFDQMVQRTVPTISPNQGGDYIVRW